MTTRPSYVMIPSRALSASISPQLFRYFCWLCDKADKKGVSWWSRRRTAELFGVKTRTVTVWRSTLEAADLIMITRRYGRSSVLTIADYPTSSGQLEVDFRDEQDELVIEQRGRYEKSDYLPDEHT